MSFSIVTSIVGICARAVWLLYKKEAQPRHLKKFIKAFLDVLAFQLSELVSGHLTPVGGKRAIHFPADREHGFFVGVRGKRCGELFFEHSEAAFEGLKIERRRRFEKRSRVVEAFRGFVESRCQCCVRGAPLFCRSTKPGRVALEIFFQFLARERLGGWLGSLDLRARAGGRLARFFGGIENRVHAICEASQLTPAGGA